MIEFGSKNPLSPQTRHSLAGISLKQRTFAQLVASADSAEVIPLLHLFVDNGGNVNETDLADSWTLLRVACEHMNRPMIEALGRFGVDPNAKSGIDGWSAMHHAVDIDIDSVWQATHAKDLAANLTFDTVRAVAEIGGRFDVLDAESKTPLDLAASYGTDVVAKLNAIVRDTTT